MDFLCRIRRAGSAASVALAVTLSSQILTGLPARAGGSCFANFTMNDRARSYHMTLNMPRVSESVDMVKPDRMHVVMTQMEMTVIGKRAWMREGAGAWKPAPMAIDMAHLMSMTKALVEKDRTGDTCVDAGMGLYHGQPAHIFKGTHAGSTGSSKGTIYVLGDGFVHHIDATTSRGPMTMDFSGFNSTSVNPPN